MTAAEALRVLHERGRIRSPWLPGMRLIAGPLDSYRWTETGWLWASGARSPADLDMHGEPDLTDPATVGCLLALLREAVGPWTPEGRAGATIEQSRHGWHVWVQTGPGARDQYQAWTEGGAIAAALIALAEAP